MLLRLEMIRLNGIRAENNSTTLSEAWTVHPLLGQALLLRTQKKLKTFLGKKSVCTVRNFTRILTFLLAVQYILKDTRKRESNGITVFLFLDKMANGYASNR